MTDTTALAAAQAAPVPDPGDVPAGSPLALLFSMETEMVRRGKLIQLYEDYTDGRHQVSFVSGKYRETFGQALAAVNDNWMNLVLRVGIERLGVIGLTLKGDKPGSDEAYRMWESNGLPVDSPLLFKEASKIGEAYTLTWLDRPRPGVFGRFFSRPSGPEPVITVEHPAQVIVRREAGNRRRITAALKRWIEDDDRTLIAYLYTPEKLYRFRRTKDTRWAPYDAPGAPAESKNPYGEVLVAPIVNDPQMLPAYPPTSLLCAPHSVGMAAIGLGRSDLPDVISTQDSINLLLCHFLVNSEARSFTQRWGTGIEVPVDPVTKEPIEDVRAALDRMWTARNEDAKFGAFPADDSRQILDGISHLVLSLASRSSTPAHYLPHPTGQYPSGESLKAAETSTVVKHNGKKDSYNDGLQMTIRHGFIVRGDRRRAMQPAEVTWRDVETRSESEFVDSLVKKLALGVPHEQLWIEAGYSPGKITDMKEMLRDQDVIAQLLAAGDPTRTGLVDDPPPTPEPVASAG